MGRLRRRRALSSMLLRQIRLWIIPVIVAGIGIFGVNLALADTAPPPSRLEQYLQDVQLIPHSETVENYQQVYYLFGKQKVFVTSDNMNHTNPISSGRYIVWLGSSNDVTSQVYLYDVLTNTTLQLSGLSTNTYPDMDGNRVVWQQWVDNGWQVMYYDGLQVIQISGGASSFRPRILGDTIVYVTYDANDANHTPWHIIQYNTITGQSSLVSATDKTTQTWPHFSNKGELKSKYDLDYLSN